MDRKGSNWKWNQYQVLRILTAGKSFSLGYLLEGKMKSRLSGSFSLVSSYLVVSVVLPSASVMGGSLVAIQFRLKGDKGYKGSGKERNTLKCDRE